MKRLMSVVLAVALMAVLAATLAACGGDNSSKLEISYGKRYISKGSVSYEKDTQDYYMLKNDGTGEYKDYRGIVKFKYIIIEETAICFFDSFEPSNSGYSDISSDWTAVLGFSKDILMGTSGDIYICEDFLENIPNFCK